MTAHIRTLLLILAILLSLAQTGLCNWDYSGDPDGNGTQGFFGFKANVIESGGNYSTSTAVLTSFSGPSIPQSIPPEVCIGIIVNPGTPEERSETVTCTVQGFSEFTLNSDAHWVGDVNILWSFNLNGYDLAVSGNVIHQGGEITFGDVLQGNTKSKIKFLITGNYRQQRDSNGDGIYEIPFCRLSMTDDAALMEVDGMVQFWNSWDSWHYDFPLRAGLLKIKGDFLQKGKSTLVEGQRSFYAIGTHRVLLAGTGPQMVSFESGYCYFNILEVGSSLEDSSTISVASELNLASYGADIVRALDLGGTPRPNGLYDSTNTNGLITGAGKIQVGAFANYSAWTDANAPGQSTDQDHDHDGLANGIEYFMGKSGNEFTTNPGIAHDGTVTWPKSPAFSGSDAVQTSEDLVEWTDVTEDAAQVTTNPDSVIWTRPTGPGSRFVRLIVMPN